MKYEYAIIVKSKTRLENLIERFNTRAQAKFYIERQGGTFEDYEREHEVFQDALHTLQTGLSRIIKNKVIERQYLPSFLFSEKNLIIVIGQDGLVANTAKYANGCPIIAVNPDSERYDGVLLPFNVNNFHAAVDNTLGGKSNLKRVPFAEAALNNGQRLLAFNDLYIGAASHVSSRYKISYLEETEEQSSSGIIVSTQAGSTGWLSSVFNMAYGVTEMYSKGLVHKQPKLEINDMLFAVREPFRSVRTQAGIVAGKLNQKNVLTIESLMPTNGVIFSDGIETDFLKFNSGAIARIGLAKESALLVTG